METTIELKFKIDDNKEITLSEQEAKDLFFKLKEIFDNREVYIPYYQPYPKDWTYYPSVITYNYTQ